MTHYNNNKNKNKAKCYDDANINAMRCDAMRWLPFLPFFYFLNPLFSLSLFLFLFRSPALISRSLSNQISFTCDAYIRDLLSLLSPLLPFTGGLDLRKKVSYYYYNVGEVGTVNATTLAWAKLRGGADCPNGVCGGASRAGGGFSSGYDPTSDKSGPLLGNSKMKDLFECKNDFSSNVGAFDLVQLSDVFHFSFYGSDNNGNKPERGSALAAAKSSSLKSLIDASIVASLPGLSEPVATASGGYDALTFCALMRAFADWRILRLVPKGFKGYSVGMELGKKDVIQNIAKVETAIKVYHATYGVLPTIRQLMEAEADYHGQKRLPKLRDPSGAIGLLWMFRQLKYQYCIHKNLAEHNMPAKDAVPKVRLDWRFVSCAIIDRAMPTKGDAHTFFFF